VSRAPRLHVQQAAERVVLRQLPRIDGAVLAALNPDSRYSRTLELAFNRQNDFPLLCVLFHGYHR